MEDQRRAVLLDCGHNGGGIAEIDGDHLDAVSRGYEVGIRARCAFALCAKHLDAATNEILSEVRPILAADTCYQRSFGSHCIILLSAGMGSHHHPADATVILLL